MVAPRRLAAWSLVAVAGCFGDPPPVADEGGSAATTTTADETTTSTSIDPDGTTMSSGPGPTSADTSSADTSTGSSSESSTSTTEQGCAARCDTGHCDVLDRCARIVFVSSNAYDGNIGGLEGADDECNIMASDAGLPGQYAAWLSDEDQTAPLRVGLTDGGHPFALVDGTVVADSGDQFLAVGGEIDLKSPIGFDEHGAPTSQPPMLPFCGNLGAPMVWTGTSALGTITISGRCGEWQSSEPSAAVAMGNSGRADRADAGWTEAPCDGFCNEFARIYCFQLPP
jgi:hypothetical protein